MGFLGLALWWFTAIFYWTSGHPVISSLVWLSGAFLVWNSLEWSAGSKRLAFLTIGLLFPWIFGFKTRWLEAAQQACGPDFEVGLNWNHCVVVDQQAQANATTWWVVGVLGMSVLIALAVAATGALAVRHLRATRARAQGSRCSYRIAGSGTAARVGRNSVPSYDRLD